uniref:Uncharacterized protein n=1 Tax=Anguilla anguilla TaxID=7936 RepID=A0A0E9QJR8_ANGAN
MKLCWLVRSNISRKPMASLKKAVVRLRNLSCPAVSHSCRCTLNVFPAFLGAC